MKVQLTHAIYQALRVSGVGVLTETQDIKALSRKIGEVIYANNPDGTKRTLFVFGTQFQDNGTTLVIVGNGTLARTKA